MIDFIRLLEKKINLYAVVLFGSVARGVLKDYDDIDLAVFSENFGKDTLEEMKLLLKLRRKINTDIEPLPFSNKDYFDHSKTDFIEGILRDGKVIYKEGRLLLD